MAAHLKPPAPAVQTRPRATLRQGTSRAELYHASLISFNGASGGGRADGGHARSIRVAARHLTPGITRPHTMRAAFNLANDILAEAGRVHAVVMWRVRRNLATRLNSLGDTFINLQHRGHVR